jgi:hypothetical protein
MIMGLRVRRILLALAVLLGAAGAASADGDGSKAAAVRDALAAGQPVVLALAQELPTGEGDETDADWAYYLNEFAAAHGRYKIVAMDAAEARSLLATPPTLDDYYATIFVRSPDSAVIYDGPVLETAVYKAAADFLEAPQDGQFDADVFQPFALDLK